MLGADLARSPRVTRGDETFDDEGPTPLDCALWDLRLKRTGRTIWDLLDLRPRGHDIVVTCPPAWNVSSS